MGRGDGARRNLSDKLDAEAARARAEDGQTDGRPKLALAKALKAQLKKELEGKL